VREQSCPRSTEPDEGEAAAMTTPEMEAEEARNKDLVLRFLDAAHSGDMDTFIGSISEDCACYGPGPMLIQGRETLRGQITEVAAQIYRLGTVKMEVQHALTDGPFVAVQFILHATLANGDDYDNYYFHLFECRNGEIVAYWKYLDTAYVARKFELPAWLTESDTGVRGDPQPSPAS
jgi:ketosteroid isomerase-like protein